MDKMRRNILLLQLLMTAILVMAEPAKRGQFRTINLSDGSQVNAELVGDEFMNYWKAEDGRCFVKQGDKYVIANLKSMAASAAQKRSLRASKHLAPATRGVGTRKSYIGKKKGLIILVQFPDRKFKGDHDVAFYQNVANKLGYTEGDFKGSVHDYFADQSNGVFDLTFDIVGPYTLQNNYAYYGGDKVDDDGTTYHDVNAAIMMKEAVTNAAQDVDFSPYDWDDDNEVEQIFVIYAGQAQSNGGGEDTVWPHEYAFSSSLGSPMYAGNIKVDVYACAGELGRTENVTSGIGTICHEYTHCLGIPDFYDTSDNETQNYGMGYWDIMCNGSHSGEGFCPPNYSSWEKWWCGWLTPTELTEDTSITNLQPTSAGGGAYIMYNDNHKDEYYLLECRNQVGWDSQTAGKGLMILYVDYDSNAWRWNVPNAYDSYYDAQGNRCENDHQRCTIVPADNAKGTKTESGDLYPYNLNNSFSNTSTPSATLYNANTDGRFFLNKSIRNITWNDNGTVSFDFVAVDTITKKVLEGVLFSETFDRCSGVGGNDGIWEAKRGTLETDYSGWSYTANTGFGANKCARFGTSAKKGIATSPNFDVSEENVLTFKAASCDAETATIKVNIQNSSTTTVEPSTFNIVSGQWTDCKATIKGEGNIKLSFFSSKNMFFIDDIKVEATSGSTGIKPVINKHVSHDCIYDLQGRNLGTNPSALKKGIYIINGKKVAK